MTKEYLKMADFFCGELSANDNESIGSIIDSEGKYVMQAMENSHMSACSNNKDRNELRKLVAAASAHAINSHDELVAEVERLREFERDAMRYRWLMQNAKFGIGRNGKDWDLQVDGSAPDAISEISKWIDPRMHWKM